MRIETVIVYTDIEGNEHTTREACVAADQDFLGSLNLPSFLAAYEADTGMASRGMKTARAACVALIEHLQDGGYLSSGGVGPDVEYKARAFDALAAAGVDEWEGFESAIGGLE
jgi:hypothetical protein